MTRLSAVVLALLLGGCAHRIEQKVVTVHVPTPVPCIAAEDVPVKPEYRTGRGEYPGEKEAAQMLAADFEAAEQYGIAWEAAAAGCIEGNGISP